MIVLFLILKLISKERRSLRKWILKIVGMSPVTSASAIVGAFATTRAIVGTSPTARIAIANVCAGGADVNVSSASTTSDIVIANTRAIVTMTAPDALSTTLPRPTRTRRLCRLHLLP